MAKSDRDAGESPMGAARLVVERGVCASGGGAPVGRVGLFGQAVD